MAIPVYIGSTKVGEAEKPDDVVRIARGYGIRRFVVYAVTAHGEVPVSPSNWSDVVKNAKALRIVRKEIAGAGAGDAVQRALEELRGELSRVEEELRRLGDYRERLVKAIKALEELTAPAEASPQARAVSEEERAPASDEGAGADLYVWEADDDEDWDDEEDWD